MAAVKSCNTSVRTASFIFQAFQQLPRGPISAHPVQTGQRLAVLPHLLVGEQGCTKRQFPTQRMLAQFRL
jgi:hypothetical protein